LAAKSAGFHGLALSCAGVFDQGYDGEELGGVGAGVAGCQLYGGKSETDHDGCLDRCAVDDGALGLSNHVEFKCRPVLDRSVK
jgi:hypothetical protein